VLDLLCFERRQQPELRDQRLREQPQRQKQRQQHRLQHGLL
jgi:hypothetical protein